MQGAHMTERVELTIAERALIRGRISQTGFVQTLLAKVLNIQQSTLNQYLTGRSAPYPTIAAIGSVLMLPEIQAAYPEEISPEDAYKRQRNILTLLYEVWLNKLPARVRLEHYNEVAWLIERTPPYGPKPISMMLRAYAGGPSLEAPPELSSDERAEDTL